MRTMAMALVASLAVPAAAQDLNGYRAIAGGDMVQAEQELLAQREEYPARPELMLNLAHVYAKTSRIEQARALYREVLSRRTVAMDLANGSVVTSHALAQEGLARLGNTAIAAR